MKPYPSTVREQFKVLLDDAQKLWDMKNSPPTAPTFAAIEAEIKAGKLKLNRNCACKLDREFSYKYSSPSRSHCLSLEMFRVPCVEKFLTTAANYKARRDAAMKRLTLAFNEAQNAVLYGKADFNVELRKFARIKVSGGRNET
jgi:hypothetical protein